jgi:Ig-like domain-containing protein
MNQSARRILFTALAVIFVLSACAPAQPPTPNPTDIANQVATSVALTVASENLETQQAEPIVTDTPSPTPTLVVVDTPTSVLPTPTPFVIVPPTTVPGGGGPVVQPDYACTAINRRPFDYQIFRPGDDFDVRWTIVNIGRKTMARGLDLKYSAGKQFISVNRVELPELKPGAKYEVIFDAVAPAKKGKYIMTYIVEGGLCYPYAAIDVE